MKRYYKERGCCFEKVPLTLSMYLILMVFILIFILSLGILLHDGIGKVLYVENLVRVLLNFSAIAFFVRALAYSEVYGRRSEARIGCFLMQLDAIIVSCCMVLDHNDIWMIIPVSCCCLVMYTWFAVICYKWQLDERRRNALQIGVPIKRTN